MDLKIVNPDILTIDFASELMCAFFSDGKAYRELTAEMIDRIIRGDLIVTEYHETPLWNVVYLSPKSMAN